VQLRLEQNLKQVERDLEAFPDVDMETVAAD